MICYNMKDSNMMKNFFAQNRCFLFLTLMFVLTLLVLLLCYPKAQLHLLLCSYHNDLLDLFFRYYTKVAEILPYVLIIGLLFYNLGWSVFTLSAVALSGLFTQILKHIVNAQRPMIYFAEYYPDVHLPLVEGVQMAKHYSFPSGHTTTFFSLFFALCILLTYSARSSASLSPYSAYRSSLSQGQSLCVQLACFFLAALGGYSRIYLSQHFALDVFAGAIIGTATTICLYPLLTFFATKRWAQWSINQQIKRIKQK